MAEKRKKLLTRISCKTYLLEFRDAKFSNNVQKIIPLKILRGKIYLALAVDRYAMQVCTINFILQAVLIFLK